jgi:hypothetical protein
MPSGQPDATSTGLLYFAAALFTALIFVYIFRPVETERANEKSRLVFLYERKEQTFENLRDLNFEYKAGKLSEADFLSMRDSMEQEAATLLAEIEEMEQGGGIRPPQENGLRRLQKNEEGNV